MPMFLDILHTCFRARQVKQLSHILQTKGVCQCVNLPKDLCGGLGFRVILSVYGKTPALLTCTRRAPSARNPSICLHLTRSCLAIKVNVAPDLMEGSGLMKSFRGIIQNQLLFEGFGIMKSFGDRNQKIADSES